MQNISKKSFCWWIGIELSLFIFFANCPAQDFSYHRSNDSFHICMSSFFILGLRQRKKNKKKQQRMETERKLYITTSFMCGSVCSHPHPRPHSARYTKTWTKPNQWIIFGINAANVCRYRVYVLIFFSPV